MTDTTTNPAAESRPIPKATPTILVVKDRAAPGSQHQIDDDRKLILRDFPTPTRSTPTQVLVRVRATSFTRGELTWPEPNSLAHPIPCRDFAGTVLEAPSSSHFKRGDKVYGLTSFYRQGHGRAISVAEEAELSVMPENMSFEEAAAVPMGALTAWQALFVHAGFEAKNDSERNAEKRLMITGAAGAVGVWVVQLAQWAGIGKIVAVVSPGAGETTISQFVRDPRISILACKQLGPKILEGRGDILVDAVIDCAGGQRLEDAWTAAKSGGVVISVAQPPESRRPAGGVQENVKGVWFIVNPDGEMLDKITREVLDKGGVRGLIDSVVDFKEFWTAWTRTEYERRAKVVMKEDE